MSDLTELFRVGVPAVVVPLAVFGANWAYRQRQGYAQTAAADFILAVLIFDGGVIATFREFEPLIRHPELRTIIVNWHMTIAFVGGVIWYFITKWGEPRIARYYAATPTRPRFPFFTLASCWVAVFMLVSVHVGFFAMRGVGHG